MGNAYGWINKGVPESFRFDFGAKFRYTEREGGQHIHIFIRMDMIDDLVKFGVA